jgi:hypothetical protein
VVQVAKEPLPWKDETVLHSCTSTVLRSYRISNEVEIKKKNKIKIVSLKNALIENKVHPTGI